MTIKVTVQWRVRPSTPQSFTCDRKSFVDFMKRKSEYVDWLIADVCLTRWYFNGTDWYSMPLFKYVPNQAMVRLKSEERHSKIKHSPNGFTQF